MNDLTDLLNSLETKDGQRVINFQKTGKYLLSDNTLNTPMLFADLLVAISQLHRQNSDLKQRIADLEEKKNDVEKREICELQDHMTALENNLRFIRQKFVEK